MALTLIGPYISAWDYFGETLLTQNAEFALVGFHTLFNTIGVLLMLPFAKSFSRLIEWFFPEKSYFGDRLGKEFLETPELALSASFNAMQEIWRRLLAATASILGKGGAKFSRGEFEELDDELEEIQAYIGKINLGREKHEDWFRLVHLIHALDHMQRLYDRVYEDADRAQLLEKDEGMDHMRQQLLNAATELQILGAKREWDQMKKTSEHLAHQIKVQAKALRGESVKSMGAGELGAEACESRLAAIRWANRLADHLATITLHFRQAVLVAGARKPE